MKTVLMIALFLGGLAIQQADAQNCCVPCPPGCCLTCSKSAKGSAADAKTAQPIEAVFASFLVAAKETLGETSSPNAMNACQPACQAKSASTSLCQASYGVGMFPAMEAPKREKQKS